LGLSGLPKAALDRVESLILVIARLDRAIQYSVHVRSRAIVRHVTVRGYWIARSSRAMTTGDCASIDREPL